MGELEIEHKGVLLGVRGGIPGLPTYREEVRQLPPGSTLVFYTDGLTDRRQRLDRTGHYTEAEAVEMLRSAVHAVAGADVEAIAQAAVEAVPGEIDDDMAIVVVRTSRSDLASWECAFPAEPIRVSEARRQARAVLIRWGVPEPYVVSFTTRRGGVSDGPYESLNLGRLTDDLPARVEENRRRACADVGADAERLAMNRQVHAATVHRAIRLPG